MNKIEDFIPDKPVHRISPNSLITVGNTQQFGSKAPELTYARPSGKVANTLRYRYDEPHIEVAIEERPWRFDDDGDLARDWSEAHRIGLAHLFNSMRVVHTSVVEPLPYRVTSAFDAASPCSRTDDN